MISHSDIITFVLGIRYQCSECPYTATLKRNLKNHVKLKHSTQKQKHFDCNTCAFGTKEIISLFMF